jgi:hypothetical protein
MSSGIAENRLLQQAAVEKSIEPKPLYHII